MLVSRVEVHLEDAVDDCVDVFDVVFALLFEEADGDDFVEVTPQLVVLGVGEVGAVDVQQLVGDVVGDGHVVEVRDLQRLLEALDHGAQVEDGVAADDHLSEADVAETLVDGEHQVVLEAVEDGLVAQTVHEDRMLAVQLVHLRTRRVFGDEADLPRDLAEEGVEEVDHGVLHVHARGLLPVTAGYVEELVEELEHGDALEDRSDDHPFHVFAAHPFNLRRRPRLAVAVAGLAEDGAADDEQEVEQLGELDGDFLLVDRPCLQPVGEDLGYPRPPRSLRRPASRG